jgi:hypothetical protein
MAFVITETAIGAQAIADTSTVQRHPLGQTLGAYDPTYGFGEFIYLLGVASTVIGSVVSYNATTYQTALSANTANRGDPVAVAMSANVASQYGWYQVSGLAVIKKTNTKFTPQVALFQSATTGRIMSTVASGKQILGARSANLATVTTTTSTVIVAINRPHKQGQVI